MKDPIESEYFVLSADKGEALVRSLISKMQRQASDAPARVSKPKLKHSSHSQSSSEAKTTKKKAVKKKTVKKKQVKRKTVEKKPAKKKTVQKKPIRKQLVKKKIVKKTKKNSKKKR